MSFPSGTYINQIQDHAVRQEFEALYSLFLGYLSTQHEQDGSHGNVTAKSITAVASSETGATGNITADGTGTFDGNVTADADGSPATIGSVGSTTSLDAFTPVSGIDLHPSSSLNPRVAMASGRGSFKELVWQWWDATNGWLTPIMLRDDTTLGGFSLKPGPNTNGFKAVYLGSTTDGSGNGRWAGVYAKAVDTQSLSSTAAVTVGAAISPTQITADQNNYNPTGFLSSSTAIVTSDAARTITGFAAGSTGQRIRLLNNGSFTITLAYNSASSSAGNRMVCPNRANYSLVQGGMVNLEYQSGAWFVG